MSIFEILKGLSRKKDNARGTSSSSTGKKDPSYIYLDDKDNQIKEIPLSNLDSAGAYINRTMNYNSPKLIHDFMFGK
jgi:hypothetical protein